MHEHYVRTEPCGVPDQGCLVPDGRIPTANHAGRVDAFEKAWGAMDARATCFNGVDDYWRLRPDRVLPPSRGSGRVAGAIGLREATAQASH